MRLDARSSKVWAQSGKSQSMSKHRNAENQSAQSYERQLRFGSMLRKLLPSGSRRWITPIVMLLLLLGIVAGAVIVSSVTQRHVQLDDGTVWVTSLKDRKAARFNVRNRDADAGVASTAARFDVAQHDGSTVISEGTRPATSRPPPSAKAATPPSNRICGPSSEATPRRSSTSRRAMCGSGQQMM